MELFGLEEMTKTILAIVSLATAVTVFIGGAALASEPSAPPAADPGAAGKTDAPACLRSRRIVGWLRLDDSAVVLRTHSQKFKVTFVGPCRQSHWAYGVGGRSYGMCLRTGDTVIFTPSYGMDPGCTIDTVTLLPKDWVRPPKDKAAK